MSTIKPEIGEWYRDGDSERFEVVAIDDDEEVIEIQYFDGTIEEIFFEDWEDGDIVKAEMPELL